MKRHLFGWSGIKGWDRCRRCGLFRELRPYAGTFEWWYIDPARQVEASVEALPCKEAA